MEHPDRVGLGLTSTFLECDRLECRYIVEADSAELWPRFARRQRIPRRLLALLEYRNMPERWWVSKIALAAARDAQYEGCPLLTEAPLIDPRAAVRGRR
jgi:hypothetical protein